VRTTVEWIRFEHEIQPYGVFSYLADAREQLDDGDAAELERLRAWFCDHLEAPDVQDAERFWFKADATEHVAQARRLAALVRAAGIPIVERRTRRTPGKVRREDAHQVAVHTYRDTPRSRRGSGGDHG
jgi:hypothetical protein